MKAGLRSLIWLLLGAALVVIPILAFEKTAQYYYLAHQQAVFFLYSGYRWFFDIIWTVVSALLLGNKMGLTRAWLACLLSTLVLTVLLYVACDPRLCYSTGNDGFEWLRMGSFLAALGIGAAFLGALPRRGSIGNRKGLLAGGCLFYLLAYNHTMFTMAGASMAPLGSASTLAFLGVSSFVVTITLAKVSTPAWRVASTVFPQVVLTLLGFGIAWQYRTEVLAFSATALAAVASGALLGAVALRGGVTRHGSTRWAGLALCGLVVFVLLTTVVVIPNAVVGQVVSASNSGQPATFASTFPYYVGGFMPGPDISPRVTAVGVNVSIPESDQGSLGQGNLLAGGIGVHSADCCTDGIDYGFRFDLGIASNGSESLTGSAWRICDDNAACGGHSWKTLMYYFSIPYPRDNPEEPVRLRLQWENRTVSWEAVAGSDSRVAGTFVALPHMNAAFNVGSFGSIGNPYLGGAFFQFGVTALGQPRGSWDVTLSCPSILSNRTWTCISHAESLQGDQSTWKAIWRWGVTFPDVGYTSDPSGWSVTFSDSSSTMQSLSRFW